MAIHHHTPKSTNVASYSYDDVNRTLEVTFSGHRTYKYGDVPQEVVDNLTRFRSKGEFINGVIKPRYKVIAGPEGERE